MHWHDAKRRDPAAPRKSLYDVCHIIFADCWMRNASSGRFTATAARPATYM